MVTIGQVMLSIPSPRVVQAQTAAMLRPCHQRKAVATAAASSAQVGVTCSHMTTIPIATTMPPSTACRCGVHHVFMTTTFFDEAETEAGVSVRLDVPEVNVTVARSADVEAEEAGVGQFVISA